MKKKLTLTMMGLILSANLCAKDDFTLMPISISKVVNNPKKTANAVKNTIEGVLDTINNLETLHKEVQGTVGRFQGYKKLIQQGGMRVYETVGLSAEVIQALSRDLQAIQKTISGLNKIIAQFNKKSSQKTQQVAKNMQELINVVNVVRESLVDSASKIQQLEAQAKGASS